MLTTALRPRSILTLLVSLGLAVGFVLLSQWQLESSERARTVEDPAKDVAVPLAEAAEAGAPVTAAQADQLVTVTGDYRDGSTLLVPGRLQDGTEGYWVVSALTVADSAGRWPDAAGELTVAVARGWTADPAAVPAEPEGRVGVVGRYLPAEGPVPGEDLPDGQVGTVSPAQLTNLWDAPLYAGFVAAFAENPASAPFQLREDGTLVADPALLSPRLSELEIDQQPTDESVNLLNLFYAVEWVVFAGFALYIWWRFVRDEWLREQHPEEYFYFEGEYYLDEASGRYYYYDPEAGEYYWFDDQPGDQPRDQPGEQPGDRARGAGAHDRTQDRTGAHHD
ncbi:SURF1 family cytochrome oxidase biogenesis protein [Kocuria turfanensis]|uniref:SURF1-like protein n=1 Tax=Kocuria turfanensis TaxID=388357 RepID=A0A512I857_9MICC|nr:SURF1 family cytochrome oxidase biogenesis protein [Kocuria turfanensis]GEO93882.1 SURF1-like protein [Kocuria turfanensis]